MVAKKRNQKEIGPITSAMCGAVSGAIASSSMLYIICTSVFIDVFLLSSHEVHSSIHSSIQPLSLSLSYLQLRSLWML